MALLLLLLFLAGSAIAALALTARTARTAAIAIVALSLALAAAAFFGIAAGLAELSRGFALLVAGGVATIILVCGWAFALGMLDAATTGPSGPIWDILFGTLVLGFHAFFGQRLVKRSYGLADLAWDLLGIAALLRGIYYLHVRRNALVKENGGPIQA